MRIISQVKTMYRVTTKLGISHTLRLVKVKFSPVQSLSTEVNLEELSGVIPISSEKLLEIKFPTKGHEIRNLEREYLEYINDFSQKQSLPRNDFFEPVFDLGPSLAKFLYIAIRLTKPFKVIETGVAAGASTNTLLTAIQNNSSGSLTSIDITPRVGELVDQNLRVLWDFQVINPNKAEEEFLSVLMANREAKFFLHDSDHSLDWQIIELSAVRRVLGDCDIVAFDDVSTDFLKNLISLEPLAEVFLLNERRKYSAVIFFNQRDHVD